MKLKYGQEKFKLNEDRLNDFKVLLPNEEEGLDKPQQQVAKALNNPIASDSVAELVEKKNLDTVVIVVNDISRTTPYSDMLPPLLNELHQAGINKDMITFVIATGIHRPNTKAENESVFGKELVEDYNFVSHNPDQDLVDLGKLSFDNQLLLNRRVVEADLLITTGVIAPHYFAGFSGGRKSILPGVAGRDTIQRNHAAMVNLLGDLPDIKENPVSLEMLEAANEVGVDFILNVVINSDKEIVEVVAGDLDQAWYQGVDTSSEMYHVELEEKADVAIVSAGGYPKDLNIYQAQKALDNANYGVKEGGSIVLLARCEDGLGEETFEKWLEEADKPEDNVEKIKQGFVIGGHKAFAISKVTLDKDFILISDFESRMTEMLYATKADDLDDALDILEEKHGPNYKSIIMPQGALTLPIVK